MSDGDQSASGATRSGWKLRIRWAMGAVAAAGLILLLPGAGAASPITVSTYHGMGLIKTNPAPVTSAQTAAVHIEAASLPASVDLTPYAMPVGDQGQVGSCAAWATDYTALGYWENKQGMSPVALEPMYTYSQVTGGHDNGSSIEGNLQIDQSQGVDNQADYTQGNFDYWDQPTAAEKAHAVNWKLTSYADLSIQPSGSSAVTKQSIESALAAGNPVVIGIPVYSNFESIGTANQGYYAGASGSLLGYHAITALGYNANGLVIENSWGTGWGNHGYATLSWSFVNQYVFDAVSVSPLRASVPASTATPSVTGNLRVGQTLTAGAGTWSPAATSYAYQWQRSSNNSTFTSISGATGATYVATTADASEYLRVRITGTNSSGAGTPVTSASVGPISGAPYSVSLPVLTGTPARGSALHASTGTWSPAPTTYAYQWQKQPSGSSTWSNISGATASSYTPAAADEKATLRVQVTGTNAYGHLAVVSAATAAVKASPPANSVAPTITGTVAVGRQLSASTGAWSGTGNAYAYQWQRNTTGSWSTISGATHPTYTATSGDAGATLRVVVTASNPDGAAAAPSPTTARLAR